MNKNLKIWKKGNNQPVVTITSEKVYSAINSLLTLPRLILWVQLIKLEHIGRKTIYVCALRENEGAMLHTSPVELEAVLLYQETIHQMQNNKNINDFTEIKSLKPCRIDWDLVMESVPQVSPGLVPVGSRSSYLLNLSDILNKIL